MKKTVFLLLIVVLFPASIFAGSSDTLDVMSFNIRFGELASLEQLGTYIKSKHPDLVALQECDWKLTRERAPQQSGKAYMNELAYFSEMFGLYGKAIEYKGGYYGVGLLSKYPIIKSERIYLPNPEPKKEQRVMLVAQIELPGPYVVTFVCTHLEVSSAEQRKAQIEFINRKIQEIQTPVILAGDFNAKPQDAEIQEGFNQYCNATDSLLTFSTTKPSIKIDYIYGYPKNCFQLISTRTDQNCKLSDHFPVQSRIRLLYDEFNSLPKNE